MRDGLGVVIDPDAGQGGMKILSFPLRRRELRKMATERVRQRVVSWSDDRQRMPGGPNWNRISLGRRLFVTVIAMFVSILLHGTVFLVGIILKNQTGSDRMKDRETTIDFIERVIVEPPQKPLPEPKAVDVSKLKEALKKPEKELQVNPEEPQRQKSEKKDTLRRIVGISLDSTGGGGAGRSFAVGNTRLGKTDEVAVDPEEALKSTIPEKFNKVATRIPRVGVRYTMPKRKRTKVPVYPELLKNQGIEADVTVMLSIDTIGRVKEVKIIKPAEYPEFNEAARLAAYAEEFEPALKNGIAVPYTLSFTYRFRLEER